MKLQTMKYEFSICKLRKLAQIDFEDEFCFVAKTDEELSLVCTTGRVPADTLQKDDGWRAFRIQGTLDFSLIGILARISSLLADSHIGIFAVSTYNTDYIFTKNEYYEKARDVLQKAGYAMEELP
jgi:hypothetical protein